MKEILINNKTYMQAIEDNDGKTIKSFLVEAIRGDNIELVENVLSNLKEDTKISHTVPILLFAVNKKNKKIIKLMFKDHRFDPSQSKCYVFFRAYKNQNIVGIELLWENEKVVNFLKEKEPDIFEHFNKLFSVKDKLKQF